MGIRLVHENKKVSSMIARTLFKKIDIFSRKSHADVFIVGGYLRDLLMGRATNDFDFVVTSQARTFTKNLSRILNGSFVVLDESNQTYRIVLKKKPGIYNLDFSQMRGNKIEEDLGFRDFTLNALAYNIRGFSGVRRKHIIDPCHGLKDIDTRKIKAISKDIFAADPLRLLRAYRLSATLGFTIDMRLRKMIPKASAKIKNVSQERIREELLKILSVPNSYKYICSMDKCSLLEEVFPEINLTRNMGRDYYQKDGLWGHMLETLKCFERLIKKLPLIVRDKKIAGKILEHLDETISFNISRITVLKFACLFHDIGKPSTCIKTASDKVRFFGHDRTGAALTADIMLRLRMPNKTIHMAKKIISNHMRPSNLSSSEFLTDKGIHRYFRDLREEGVDTLLLSLADRYAYRVDRPQIPSHLRRHHMLLRKMFSMYYNQKDQILRAPLLSGNDLIAHFKLQEGPLIGFLLNQLEDARSENRVKNKRQALVFLKDIIDKIV